MVRGPLFGAALLFGWVSGRAGRTDKRPRRGKLHSTAVPLLHESEKLPVARRRGYPVAGKLRRARCAEGAPRPAGLPRQRRAIGLAGLGVAPRSKQHVALELARRQQLGGGDRCLSVTSSRIGGGPRQDERARRVSRRKPDPRVRGVVLDPTTRAQ